MVVAELAEVQPDRKTKSPAATARLIAETCVEDIVGAASSLAARALIVDSIQTMRSERIEAAPGATEFSLVTFLWHGDNQTRNVVIFDGVAGFHAKDQMLHLDGSYVWYKT